MGAIQQVRLSAVAPAAGGGGAARVQSIHEYGTDGVLAFASPVTAGSLLIAVCRGGDATTPTITSVPIQSWTQAVAADGIPSSQAAAAYIYYLPNATGGTTTVTNATLQSDASLTLYEISGILTSSPLNATATGLGGVGTTTPTSDAFNPNNADFILFSYCNESADATFAAGTGYLDGELDHGQTMYDQYKLSATSGSQTPSFTTGTSVSQYVIAVATFKTV